MRTEEQKHEDAIHFWRFQALATPCKSPGGESGFWLHAKEINRADELMRARPTSEPSPEDARCADCGEPTPVLLAHCCEHPNPSPVPEPRASSALLEAAREALFDLDEIRYGQRPWRVPRLVQRDIQECLRKTIEAEEARGPIDADELRAELARCQSSLESAEKSLIEEREEHAEVRINLAKERDEARDLLHEAQAPITVEVGGEMWVLERHEAVEKIRELAERVEKAEANANAKLREVADWVRAVGDCTEEEALAQIDRLLANHTSVHRKVASVDRDDRPLRKWVDDYVPTQFAIGKVPPYAEAIYELCRRELARGEGAE